MRPLIDRLEQRLLCYFQNPNENEQYLIELVNAYRADPESFANNFGIDLNEGLSSGTIPTTPRQPLAPNAFLNFTAFSQATYIRVTFDVSKVPAFGQLPALEIQDNGYPQTGTFQKADRVVGLVTGPGTAENEQNVLRLLRNLVVDNDVPGRPNRIALLDDTYREVGAGLRFDPGNFPSPPPGPAYAMSLDLATATGGTPSSVFLTGVAFNDGNGNNFYNPGEGLGGVAISARNISTNVTYTGTTYGAGGYSLALPPGSYDVIGSFGGGGGSIRYGTVNVGSKNVKRDFRTQDAGPDIVDPIDNPGGIPAPNAPNPNTIAGDLEGIVRYDRRGDGRRANLRADDVVVGLKVYVDVNNNGARGNNEPFGNVQDNGSYRITGLDPGIYKVRVETPSGFRTSVPEEAFQDVTIVSGKVSKLGVFAVTDKTVISGRVYRDLNNNTTFENGTDKGTANWRVYLDLNNDGIWQKQTEPSRVTPPQGKYAFRNLLPGTYTVRVIPKAGFLQTQPANNAPYTVTLPGNPLDAINRDFGQRLIG